MRRLGTHLAIAVASALVSATLVSALQPAAAPSVTVTPAPRAASELQPITATADRAQLSRLERRLAALETTEPDPDKAVVDEPTIDPPPEERQRQALGAWHDRLTAHDRAVIDPSWAAPAETSFSSDLQILAQSAGFELVGTDCRTHTCAASLRFADYGQALAEQGALLTHDYAVNCTREVVLPEPADPGASYQATVLYDCAN